ncbi:bifunctional diaminohydroxyphosphoribosylaminopyrimidine deaminase/5-amino-6-(5-phosphoribosylamino)uracil reductase RibD [bacterium]|nr:bifunctional diaminohydroxyphosphoribosylaminopyrimidine deaminase/5-amino-6-(5-phosphoribosylamino)uracil reductase RibD [bacterium]
MNIVEEDYMTIALNLAKKGKYTTSPNPHVGAIIVKNDRIIGKGYHKHPGKPHAEIYALNEAGSDAKGSTMYVTLEPCCHYGKTPPCTEAIINAKIKRVVIAMTDPNPLVAGKGIKKLKDAGIDVETGILENKAKDLNKYFIKYITTGMPYVIMKAAISLDGKIALNNGESKWISNDISRKKVHMIRNEVDAILIGHNTFMKDDPHLNIRMVNAKKDPYKIIIAGKKKLRNIKKMNLFKEHPEKVIIVQNHLAGNEIYRDLVKSIISLRENFSLNTLLKQLGKYEITSLLVEGGSNVFTQFILENIVDEYMIFIAPIIIGMDGIPIFNGNSPNSMRNAIKFKRIGGKFLDGNVYMEFKR